MMSSTLCFWTAQFLILDCTNCILDCTNWLDCTLRISLGTSGLSREQRGRHRKTKIGTEAAHVTHDSNTTSLSKVIGQLAGGGGILWRSPAQLVKFDRMVEHNP